MRGGVRLKRSVHRLGLAAARRAPGTVRIPRLLSIVVPVRDAEAELDECLTSLREQDYWACEIVVVDLGLPAAGAAVAARHARDDFRVRVVSSAGGLATGRNRGAELVVGEFLAFVDADDAVTRHGFAMTIAALRDSGSDLAVFAYAPTRRGHAFPVSERVQALHSTRRLGASVDTFPDLLANTTSGARVFRRRAYDDRGWAFPELACPDDAHSVAAYGSASGVDVLTHVGLLRREESDRSPLTRRTTDPDGPALLRRGRRRGRRLAAGPAVRGVRRRGAGRSGGAVPRPGLALHRRVLDHPARGRRPPPRHRRRRVASAGAGVPQGADRAGHRRRPRAGAGLPDRRPTDRSSLRHHRRAQRRPRRRGRRLRPRLGRPALRRSRPRRPGGRRAGRDHRGPAGRRRHGRAHRLGLPRQRRPDATGSRPSASRCARSPRRWSSRSRRSRVPRPTWPATSGSATSVPAALPPDSTPGRLPAGQGLWHLTAEVAVDGLVGRARVGILPWTMAGVPAWSDATGRVLAVDHDDAGRFELLAHAARRSVVDLHVAGDTLVLRLPDGVREVALEPLAGGSPVATAAVEGGRAELSLGRAALDPLCRRRARRVRAT